MCVKAISKGIPPSVCQPIPAWVRRVHRQICGTRFPSSVSQVSFVDPHQKAWKITYNAKTCGDRLKDHVQCKDLWRSPERLRTMQRLVAIAWKITYNAKTCGDRLKDHVQCKDLWRSPERSRTMQRLVAIAWKITYNAKTCGDRLKDHIQCKDLWRSPERSRTMQRLVAIACSIINNLYHLQHIQYRQFLLHRYHIIFGFKAVFQTLLGSRYADCGRPRGQLLAYNGQRPAIVASWAGRHGWVPQTHRMAITWTTVTAVCVCGYGCVHAFAQVRSRRCVRTRVRAFVQAWCVCNIR